MDLQHIYTNHAQLRIISVGNFGKQAIKEITSTQHFASKPGVSFHHLSNKGEPELDRLKQFLSGADMAIYLTDQVNELQDIEYHHPKLHSIIISSQIIDRQEENKIPSGFDAINTNNPKLNLPHQPIFSSLDFAFFYWALRSVIDPVSETSLIGFDYADIKSVLKGQVLFAMSYSSDTDRANIACDSAIKQLEENGANFTTPKMTHGLMVITTVDLDLNEFNTVGNKFHDTFPAEAELKIAISTNDNIPDRLVISIMAMSDSQFS